MEQRCSVPYRKPIDCSPGDFTFHLSPFEKKCLLRWFYADFTGEKRSKKNFGSVSSETFLIIPIDRSHADPAPTAFIPSNPSVFFSAVPLFFLGRVWPCATPHCHICGFWLPAHWNNSVSPAFCSWHGCSLRLAFKVRLPFGSRRLEFC